VKTHINFPSAPILIVDDEEDVLSSYKRSLRYNGIDNLVLCSDSREVMKLMEEIHPSIVILDLSMPYITGEQLLADIARDYPYIPVIVITGSMKIDTAVDCMKNGAYDYMVKPVEKSRLVYGVKNAIEHRAMQDQVHTLEQNMMRNADLNNPHHFSSIITTSERMDAIFRYIESVAPSPMPVLILGESGTGKELIAEAIHNSSGREGKFVTVNSAGIEGTLFADNLFGHKKGAYSGADTARAGLIEQAAGGTLFLDEIGDIDLHTQISLLRLLQQKEYYPLGSDIPKTSDARIIAATNADLSEKVVNETFRKDFYYRIKTHLVELPPLCERREDIPALIDNFVNTAAETLSKNVTAVPEEIYSLLSAYNFPGNIRELQSIIYDAVSCHTSGDLSSTTIQQYLRKYNSEKAPTIEYKDTEGFVISFKDRFPRLKEIEETCARKAFEKAGRNQNNAAILLGISQATMSRWCRKINGDSN
jgi:DNA-binding NtrC family response regulator